MIACSSRTKGAVTVFICFLAIYVYYLHPSTPYGDSTELMTVAWGLGVAHPPGYPLFILLYNFLARHVIYRFGIASLVARWLEHYFGYTCVLERAVSMHLVTALLGATTQLFLFLCVYKLLHDRPLYKTNHSSCHALSSKYALYVAFGTVYLCGMSPVVMRYATESEVFGLHNLFISIILYLYISFFTECVPELNLFPGEQKKSHEHPKRTQPSAIRSKAHDTMKQANRTQEASSSPVMHKRDRLMRVAVFFCGLSFSNQHIAVLLVVPVALVVLWATRDCYLYCPSRWASLLAIFFTPALVPYVYLWISETYMPHRSSWGGTDTWRGLVGHFLREAYGTLQLHANTSNADFFGNCFYMLLWMLNQMLSLYGGGAIVLVTAVCAWIRVKNRSITFFDASFASFILFFVVVFQSLANLNITDSKDSNAPLNFLFITVVERFWMHPYIILTVWIGMCVGDAIFYISRSLRRLMHAWQLSFYFLLKVVAVLVFGAVFIMVLASYVSEKFGAFSKYRNPLPDCVTFHSSESFMVYAPRNSISLISGDVLTTTCRYLQDVEGIRPDLSLLILELYFFAWWKRRVTQNHFFPNVDFEYVIPTNEPLNFPRFIDLNCRSKNRSVIFFQLANMPPDELDKLLALYEVVPRGPSINIVQNRPYPCIVNNLAEAEKYVTKRWEHYNAYVSRYGVHLGQDFFDYLNFRDQKRFPWERTMLIFHWKAVRMYLIGICQYINRCYPSTDANYLQAVHVWFSRIEKEVLRWLRNNSMEKDVRNNLFLSLYEAIIEKQKIVQDQITTWLKEPSQL